ncbi:TPA: hypothetical protein OUC45_003632, partial [Acinetobacter baumannii]|nr:hypothetical protein [Acinetobacter baumannii]HCT9319876.1 hypothetical protein [Acinetobacter baumannii]HCU0792559.1 hypothetical protein [Acinetobacter baumannii]HEC0063271.1 hypothetical protein [Acinetobacter baumannii]HEC0351597.1 hypothetical protein [Acinetobacter baumannii]
MNELAPFESFLKELIAAYRTKYAVQFNKNFPVEGKNAVPMQIVEQQLAKALVGVTPNQLQRGLALFYASTNTYMPNFAEFRAMCMGDDWWSAEKAWVKACEYTQISQHKKVTLPDGREQNQEITTLTKFVLDQVYSLIQDGEMYKAKMEFIKIYDEYKAEAQLKGKTQAWYQEPILLAQKNEQKVHKPVSNDEAQKHLQSLMERLKINGRKPAPVQKLKAKEKEPELAKELGPDPFDNPHEYVEMCRREGMP